MSSELMPVGYYCDHSDEPVDGRTHHDWEFVEGEGFVFQHQPNTTSALCHTRRAYLKPEHREQRCARAVPVYPGPAVNAELDQLRDELAETKALHDPRLRGVLVKADKDRDLYVQWSTACDMPGGVFSRETALEYGFPRSKVDHADEHGSSSRIGDGAWDDKGWVAEQRGWLKRDRIGDYAVEYLHGDREAAYALLEPFEGETEVRR